jgi:hypothetical protein
MPVYLHYYFCTKCVGKHKPPAHPPELLGNAWNSYMEGSHIIKSASTAAPYPPETLQHYQITNKPKFGHKRDGCNKYLTYLGWREEHKVYTASNADPRKLAAKDRLRRTKPVERMPGMICVLYDPVTQSWFDGYSGGQHTGSIPAVILTSIPTEVDVPTSRYGRGCAEVDALNRLFVHRLAATPPGTALNQDLTGCYFLAREKGTNTFRAMCTNCASWTAALGMLDLFKS